MPIKNQRYTDNVGGGYPGKEKPTSVTVKTDASKMRNSGVGTDPLARAFGVPPPKLPMGGHPFSHSKKVQPTGARYNPQGGFGKMTGKFGSKATGMGSHSSGPGSNSIGSPDGGRGSNALPGAKMPARGSFRKNA